MQIDWENAINRIFARRLTCPRCEADVEELIAGYSRKADLSPFAPRHQNCPRGEACEARKLTTLCVECARTARLRGTLADAGQLLETYMLDCRRDLEDSLDYLAEYWRDEFDLGEEHFDLPFEEVAPEAFREEAEWRHRLEEEYLRYHAEFRNLHRRIPAPGWRAEFTEEIRALGYDTSLGD